MTTKTVSVHFDNEGAAEHFMSWLDAEGQQDYWMWMEEKEQEEGGDIIAIKFMTTKTVSIHFDNEEAAGHFMSWLNGQGEQDYWTWMEEREQEEDGDISVINFDYSWNDFQITAKCGRLS